MSSLKVATSPEEKTITRLLWINRAQELLWLLAVVLVPVVFLGRDNGEWSSIIGAFELPKIVTLRTLVALLTGLWVIEWVLGEKWQVGPISPSKGFWASPKEWLRHLVDWLQGNPVGWLKLAVALYLTSTLLSTVLSVSFSVSMWGDVPGQDSYGAFTVVAYVLLFAVIATHLKTPAQLWRLIGAIVVAGLLVASYAILQQYGQDFLDLIEPPNTNRVSSTLGNATFAASLLLMTIPISLAAATIILKGPWRIVSYLWKLSLGVSVVTVQLLGLAFTLSRGPWLGTTVALVGFLVLLAIFVGWRGMAKAAILLGVAIAITAIVLSTTAQAGARDDETTAKVVTDRLSTVGNTSASGGLRGRLNIWEGSWRLMTQHSWFAFDELSLSPLRPLIGYGPDLFRTAYLLETQPNPAQRLLPNEVAQAHNYFIHQGVELGFLGLITSMGVFVAFFAGAGYSIVHHRQKFNQMQLPVLFVLVATVTGRLVEQMFGVARVSDLTMSWVLLALFAVLMSNVEHGKAALNPGQQSLPQPKRHISITMPDNSLVPTWWQRGLPLRLTLAVVLLAGIALLVWGKNINYFRAAIIADEGAAHLRSGNLQSALGSLDRAIDLAPDVATYYERRAHLYWENEDQWQDGGSPGCNRPTVLRQELCLAEESNLWDVNWVQRRPHQFRSRLASAESSMKVGTLKNDANKIEESLRLYSEAQGMVPNSWLLANRIARIHIDAGQPAKAITFLEASLAITRGTVNSLEGLLVRARAFEEMGQYQKALADLNSAIDLDYESAEIYYTRGSVYYQVGRFEDAIENFEQAIHLDRLFGLAYNGRGLALARLGKLALAVDDFHKAVHVDPGSAVLYNNRGFVNRELGLLGEAIQDLNEAIHLDPRLAIAYYNRALTQILLGNDEEAVRDAQQAVDLGFDVASVEEAMRITRDGR